MKKNFIAIAVAAASVVTLSAFTPNVKEPVTDAVVECGLQTAVRNGFGTSSQAETIKDSGIIQAALNEFLATGAPAAAVDRAADIAVEKGWAKDRATAKRLLRREIDRARKDESLMKKVYRLLGI